MRNWWIPAAIIVSLSFPLVAQNPCDPGLKPDGKTLGYRLRNSRCEGLFEEPRSGTLRLDLVGFCAVDVQTFTPASSVFVTWPGASAVHLRARSLDRPRFYRFDADLMGGSYLWRTDVLNPAGVKPQALAITGWWSDTRFENQPIYIPVRVALKSSVVARPAYRFVVVPTQDLDTFYANIDGVNADGTPHQLRAVRLNVTPRVGPYQAEKRIDIEIDAASLPTFPMWRLRVSGKSTGEMNVAETVFFVMER
jgi:hypothetical protein